MKQTVLLLILFIGHSICLECGTSLKPEKLVVVGVWKRNFDNATAQYRISDEDLSVRGYQRSESDKASSTVMLARHPEGCVINGCGVRLSAMMQVNGAILHTDHRMVRMNDSTMDNIEDEFYCAEKNNSCGATVPIYRLVQHSLTGPHYAYSFDNVGQSLPGYEKEFFPLCFAWRQTPSVVLFNSSDDHVCLTLSETSHGRISYSNNQLNVYSIGTTATLHCNHGFAGNGSSSLLCTKDGWYPKEGLGSCIEERKAQLLVGASIQSDEKVSCSIPQKTPNGNIVYSANIAESSSSTSVPTATRATVLCSIGFVPTTSVTSSKCVDGEWQPALPTCLSLLEIKCPILSAPKNGELVFTNSSKSPYSLDSEISLKCDRNFFGMGNLTATCTSTGWNQKIGRCEPVGVRRLSQSQRLRKKRQVSNGTPCTAISNPTNGNFLWMQANPTTEYSSGTSVYLMCNLGYSLSGSVSSMCTNGVWTPAIGQCTSALPLGQTTGSCEAIPTRTNGTITYTTFGTYTSGTIATLTCNFLNSVSGSPTSTCLSGIWNPTIGTCTYSGVAGSTGTSTCPNPTVLNGVINYSQGNTFDLTRPALSTATVTCNSGYTLNGNSMATCTNGVFTPALGTCNFGTSTGTGSTTTCPNPTVINGVINYSQGNTFDTTRPALSTATVTCNSGYSINGNPTATCMGGVFTPTLGTCNLGGTGGTGTGTTCTNPIVINGVITYSQGNTFDITRPALTTATLACNSGYSLSGNSQATCTNGVFTPALGTCNFGGTGGTGTGTGTVCTNPIVINGVITYSQGNTYDLTRPAMTTATLACNSGYSLSGNSQSTCTNGVFTPALGSCNVGSSTGTGSTSSCTNPTVLNGVITYSQGNTFDMTRPALTTATVACNSGYTLNGNSMATCTNGVFTPALGTCNFGSSTSGGVQCMAMIAPIGGTVRYSNGGTMGPFPSGTTVTGSCTNGGTVTGSATAQCSNGMWTPMFLGTCSLIGGSTTGQCSALTVPTGAQATYSPFSLSTTSFTSGTVATVTCTTGGSLLGTSTCTNGIWSPSITSTCNGIGSSTCPALTRPIGESVTYDGTTSFATTFNTGVIARVTCTNGTQIGQSTCTAGSWFPAITATCSGSSTAVGTQCIGAIVPTNSQIDYSDGSMVLHSAGTTATLRCLNSATLTGNSFATCTNGVWTPTLGSCTSSGTGGTGPCYTPPLTPTGATLTYSSGFFAPWTAGSSATMTCPAGQSSTGTTVTYCTNSAWSPALGTCSTSGISTGQEVLSAACPVGIPPVLAATMTYSNGSPLGPYPAATIVSATCPSGYIANGIMTASCNNGIWSPASLGTCDLVGSELGGTSCGRLGDPLSGTLVYSALGLGPYPSGTSATVLCNIGTTLSGSPTALCTNGVWNPLPGTCIATILKKPPSRSANLTVPAADSRANGTSDDSPIETPTVALSGERCPPPVAPAFGEITFSGFSTKGSFEDGTTAALKCNLGYKSNGPSFSTCRKGSFRPILGKCANGSEVSLPGVCVPLSPPRNSRVVYIQSGSSLDFEDGTTALLYCEEGFAVTGVATLQCQSGQWEPSTGFGMCDSI